MISAKEQTISALSAFAIEDPNHKLCLVTAFGIIQGVPDYEMTDVLTESFSDFLPGDQVEQITRLNTITLRDAQIIQPGYDGKAININSITVFPDQVIAVYARKPLVE